jgi:hypothetical protein
VSGPREHHPAHLRLVAGGSAQLPHGDLDGEIALPLGDADTIEHGVDDTLHRLGLVLIDGDPFGRSPAPVELDRDPLRARVAPTVGRPRSLPDYVDLLVARRVGRTLGPMEGCIVQIVAIVILAALVWVAFASGLVAAIAEVFARWYTSVIHLGPTPTP